MMGEEMKNHLGPNGHVLQPDVQLLLLTPTDDNI